VHITTLWRVRVSAVAMETQQCVPFVLLTCACRFNQVINTESVAVAAQPCRLPVVSVHMSLRTI
jgi:hypothetical protein